MPLRGWSEWFGSEPWTKKMSCSEIWPDLSSSGVVVATSYSSGFVCCASASFEGSCMVVCSSSRRALCEPGIMFKQPDGRPHINSGACGWRHEQGRLCSPFSIVASSIAIHTVQVASGRRAQYWPSWCIGTFSVANTVNLLPPPPPVILKYLHAGGKSGAQQMTVLMIENMAATLRPTRGGFAKNDEFQIAMSGPMHCSTMFRMAGSRA